MGYVVRCTHCHLSLCSAVVGRRMSVSDFSGSLGINMVCVYVQIALAVVIVRIALGVGAVVVVVVEVKTDAWVCLCTLSHV